MSMNRLATAVGGAVFGSFLLAISAGAWPQPANHSLLTFTGPFGLPGVTLSAGTYSFEVVDRAAGIVRVSSKKRDEVYYTGFTRAVPRPDGASPNAISFQETARGQVARVSSWFPEGDALGRGFIYRR